MFDVLGPLDNHTLDTPVSCRESFNHAAFHHGVFMLHEEDQRHKRIPSGNQREQKKPLLPEGTIECVCLNMYIYTYIHIHIHIYIYTHVCIYIYMYV